MKDEEEIRQKEEEEDSFIEHKESMVETWGR
jgi:hypothetical protein